MQRLLSASAAVLALSFAASAASAQNFSDLARQDLQAMHATLRDNHPAAVVPGDASAPFRAWLDAGLQQAQAKAGQVNSGDSHAYLLRWYANGFRDSNIAARPTYEGLGPFFATSWPGVATAWRNGQYVVSYVQEGVRGAPPLGAVLKSCNAEPIEDLAKAKLDQFEGDLTTEAGRVRSAPYLLWNRNNPMTTGVPGTCEFQVGRRTRDFTLSPQPATAQNLEAAYRASVYVPSGAPLSVETVNGRPWINVHSLADDAAWDAFFAQNPAGFLANTARREREKLAQQGPRRSPRKVPRKSKRPTRKELSGFSRLWFLQVARLDGGHDGLDRNRHRCDHARRRLGAVAAV